MDHYRNLGLPNNASTDRVKTAYRKLAKKYHPDKNKSLGASDKFISINNSYEYIISGKGDHALNTYKYYAQEANTPKGNPINEFDLNGDGKLDQEEYRAMKKHKLEEAARTFYNLHETSSEYRQKLWLDYFLTFSIALGFLVLGAWLAVFASKPNIEKNQQGAPLIMSLIVLFFFSIPLIGLLSGQFGTKGHKTYVKIIRKFYDPKFKILGLFNF